MHSSSIKFIQKSKTIHSYGWVDFNEFSLGLASFTSDGDVYTEIRYASIADWYFQGKYIYVNGLGI